MDELSDYASTKGLRCECGNVFRGSIYCGFSFQRNNWSKTITFQFTKPYWKGCYYGVHSLQEVKSGERMKHLKKPDSHYCFGNSYTNYKDWDLRGLITSEIKRSIIDALEITIEAINREPNKYIM